MLRMVRIKSFFDIFINDLLNGISLDFKLFFLRGTRGTRFYYLIRRCRCINDFFNFILNLFCGYFFGGTRYFCFWFFTS